MLIIVVLILLFEQVRSDIGCYYCTNSSVGLCGNATITCRYPADSCYIKISTLNTRMSKSCIYSGHCDERFLCSGISSCQLQCCHGKELCNEGTGLIPLEHAEPDLASWFFPTVLYIVLLGVLFLIMVKINFPVQRRNVNLMEENFSI